MNYQVFPDEMLQRMRFILSQGKQHSCFQWAMGVLDATLIYPPRRMEDKKYIEGYNEREKYIREAG